MDYRVALHTDIGPYRKTNQDSLCVKKAFTEKDTVLLALVCDGVGGLQKGEVASATTVNAFSQWFEETFTGRRAARVSFEDVRGSWQALIRELNGRIGAYGKSRGIALGTTMTAILFLEEGKYLICHVGDSRAYRITEGELEVLTQDQTLVNHELKKGRLTREQAERDPRKNVLLQCIGASETVDPDFILGQALEGECFMLCSDGFRHRISKQELQDALSPRCSTDEEAMREGLVTLTELSKKRGETDNISAILIKSETRRPYAGQKSGMEES